MSKRKQMKDCQNMFGDSYHTQVSNKFLGQVDCQLPKESFLQQISAQQPISNQQVQTDQMKVMRKLRMKKIKKNTKGKKDTKGKKETKKSKKKLTPTRSIRKLANANKFDMRKFIDKHQQAEKYFKMSPQKAEKLKKFNDLNLPQISKRSTSIAQMNKIFGNQSSKESLQMSYLNCGVFSSILISEIHDFIFANDTLKNKKSYYLHIYNKYMRLQRLSLVGRLQAR